VNLGIDHDSDEVVALKATISTKGTAPSHPGAIPPRLRIRLDNEITMLKVHLDQAAQQSAAVDTTLKETNHKVHSSRSLGGISLLYKCSFNPKPTDELSLRKNSA